jgi:hypothetical protein
MLIEGENVRCTDGTILARNILCLVAKVGKVETFLLRSLDHLLETVLWVIVIIIAVNRYQRYAFSGVVSLKLDHPTLIIPNVWAMVTAEHDNDRLPISKILETVGPTINALQMKVNRVTA